MLTQLENVAERPVTASPETAPARGLWARAVGHVQEAVCGLHGHDPMLQFEQGRMYLRCASCGYQSPGWDTGERRPRLPDAERPLGSLRAVDYRRSAGSAEAVAVAPAGAGAGSHPKSEAKRS